MPFLVLPLAVALLGFGQQSADAAPTPVACEKAATCSGTLEGNIRLEGGGVPVGATVFLQPLPDARLAPVGEYIVRDADIAATARGQFYGIVDERGGVRISDVRPGRYIAVIHVPGYISSETFPSTPQPGVSSDAVSEHVDSTVTVRAGAVTTFDLALQHGGSIAGVARFEDGKPASGSGPMSEEVALTLLAKRADGTFVHTLAAGAEHTDAAGRFTFADLPPGDYVLITVVPGRLIKTTEGEVRERGGFIFSGGASSLSRASIFHIAGRETQNTVIILPTTGLCDVSGRAFAADGSPLTEGIVRLKPAEDGPSGTLPISANGTHIASNGLFRFDSLLPNRYEIWIELETKTTFVGMTDDHQGIRMRAMPPPPYISPHVLVDLSGGVAESLVLQLKSVDGSTPLSRP